MRFFLIGDRDTVLAFSLIGIDGMVSNCRSETLKGLNTAINCNEIGIVLITERLAQDIQHTIDKILSQKRCRLILQIPDTRGPLAGKTSVEDFVSSALGIKV